MPRSNQKLIAAIRETANRLESGARYEWGHMGRCNCGHLVQTLVKMSDREIVSYINHETEEWTDHARGHCQSTSRKIDDIFQALYDFGFGYEDIIKLEYLSDREVLARVNHPNRYLRHNRREDVILYLRTMAEMLEETLGQGSTLARA